MSHRIQRHTKRGITSGIVMALGLLLVADAGWAEEKPAYGTITKFATVPAAPGFPEGVAVHGNSVFVSGPARFGTANTGPSAIQVYNRETEQLDQTIVVQGEALAFEHALSNVAIDGQGRVYALSTQLGLIRFTKQGQSYVQSSYGAPLPSVVHPDLPPIPNDIVFDDLGNAYVTDSLQATIFRYGPGGGVPQIWFQSPLFFGGGGFPFGPNGIRLDPDRQYVYMANTTSFADPLLGTIYRLPLIDNPQPGDLEIVHHYVAGEAPDQLAFGTSGELYVTLAFSNQISVLVPGFGEVGRISSQPGDEVPLDNPAGIAFDSRTKSLLVANHAIFSGNPAHFAVLSVYVADPGDPLSQP
jgi:sugar lactone lactonase YvrE